MGKREHQATEATVGRSVQAGNALADYFATGASAVPIAPTFRMQPGEHTFAAAEGILYQWAEGDGTYIKNSFWSLNPLDLAVGATAVAIGNRARRARAVRDSAAAWRAVERCEVTLTNQRFALQGGQWTDIWHQDINLATCDGYSLEVHASAVARLRLVLPEAHWWWVALHQVAWGQQVRPEPVPGISAASR